MKAWFKRFGRLLGLGILAAVHGVAAAQASEIRIQTN
jgi:hypothetical protein